MTKGNPTLIMTKLTLDLQTSAEVLGTTPDHFLAWLQSEQPSGIIILDNQPQVSIFTLARILDTTAQELLNLLSISKDQDLLEPQVKLSTQEIDTEIVTEDFITTNWGIYSCLT